MTLLIEAHYLPSLEYFCCLLSHQEVLIEKYEHFTKQTYRNRCYIRGANGVLDLRIPVKKGKSKTLIRDLRVDNNQHWQALHWRSLRAAYGRAPFFEHYEPYLAGMYEKRKSFLLDYSLPLLSLCLNWLQIDIPLKYTDDYQFSTEKGIEDARGLIIPKVNYDQRRFYQPVPYPQVFGNNFADNLSIIDLLSCEGPNARSVLSRSVQ